MWDQETLVFVEVRMRSNTKFGGAAASIDAKKQQKLILTAQYYLGTLAQTPPCRFDALLLNSSHEVEWLKNAFSA